jgi:BMFP domain-containing protein YqiC
MQKDNKFFDDLAKMASGAAGGLMDAKREMEALATAQFEKLLQNMRLATKEEMGAALAMLAKLRSEQEELKKRLDALEAKKYSQ